MAPMKRLASVEADKLGKVSKALKTLCSETYAGMLAGMCEASLGVPKSERHEYQASIVGMIEETLGHMEAAKKEQVEKFRAEVDQCPGSKERREAAATCTEKELAGLKEAISSKKLELEGEIKTLGEAQAALKKAEKEQKDGDASLAALEAKKARIESVLAESLSFLKENPIRSDHKALKAIVKLGKELGFDQTMLSILPELAKKSQDVRSEFDNLSMQNIDEEFAKHVEALSSAVKEGESCKAARAEAVSSAQAAMAEAQKRKAEAEVALNAARSAERAGALSLKEAKKAAASWLSDARETMDAYDQAVLAQADFSSVLATFAELKEFEPSPPPKAEEEAPATQPTEANVAPAILAAAEAPAQAPAEAPINVPANVHVA